MNIVTQIAGAELNSLWQTAMLAFLIWFAIRLFGPRWNGATRHLIWWIALTAIVILPCIRWRFPAAPVNRAHVQTQRARACVSRSGRHATRTACRAGSRHRHERANHTVALAPAGDLVRTLRDARGEDCAQLLPPARHQEERNTMEPSAARRYAANESAHFVRGFVAYRGGLFASGRDRAREPVCAVDRHGNALRAAA